MGPWHGRGEGGGGRRGGRLKVGELQALGGVPGEEQGLFVEVRVDEEHVRAYPDDDEDGEAHHQAQLSTTTGQHKHSKRCWDGEHNQGESHQGQEGTPCVEGGINQNEAVRHDGLPAAEIRLHRCLNSEFGSSFSSAVVLLAL